MHIFLLALVACNGPDDPPSEPVDTVDEPDSDTDSEADSDSEAEPEGSALTFVVNGSLAGDAVGVVWYGADGFGLGDVLGSAAMVEGRATVHVPTPAAGDLQALRDEPLGSGRSAFVFVFTDTDGDGAYDAGEIVTGYIDGYLQYLLDPIPAPYTEVGYAAGWNAVAGRAFVPLNAIPLDGSLAVTESVTVGGTVSEVAAAAGLRVALASFDALQVGGDLSTLIHDEPVGATWTITLSGTPTGWESQFLFGYVDGDGDGMPSREEYETARRNVCLPSGSPYDDVYALSVEWAAPPTSLASAWSLVVFGLKPGWRAEGWDDDIRREHTLTTQEATNLEIDVNCLD